MNWLRLYTEVLDHPKLQRLPGDLFKFWVNLLCLARLHNGVLPPIEDIAFRLRCTDGQAEEWMMQLIERRLLDKTSEGVRAHDWDQYQYDSDSSTERSRKRRATLQQQSATVDATLQQRPRLDKKRLEEEEKPLSPTVVGEEPQNARVAVEVMKKRPVKAWFDEQHALWYSAFWCHKGKAESRKAYEKALCRLVDRDGLNYNRARLLLGEKLTEDRAKFEGTQDWEWRVNLHPATWLNQERWTDEPGPEVQKLTVHQERNRQTHNMVELLEKMEGMR